MLFLVFIYSKILVLGRNHGLVVMGGVLCSEGHGFESGHRILDGYFSHIGICCKNSDDVCLKRPKINDKRGRG